MGILDFSALNDVIFLFLLNVGYYIAYISVFVSRVRSISRGE